MVVGPQRIRLAFEPVGKVLGPPFGGVGPLHVVDNPVEEIVDIGDLRIVPPLRKGIARRTPGSLRGQHVAVGDVVRMGVVPRPPPYS